MHNFDVWHMVLKFTVGNYLSFKEKTTLDMSAEALKEKKGNLHIPYHHNPKLTLLKSMAIYGHNSYGKSNLIKAYSFYKNLIINSFSFGKKNTEFDVEPFRLNTSMVNKPSHFEAVFILKQTKYRYGFEITRHGVSEEWLYYADGAVRENLLFNRVVGQQIFEISKSWNKESQNMIENAKMFTTSQNLFLSVLLSQDNMPPRVTEITKWFQGNIILTGSYANSVNNGAYQIYTDVEYRNVILKFIKGAHLEFESIFEKIAEVHSSTNIHNDLLNVIYEDKQKNFELYTGHKLFDEQKKFLGNIDFNLQKSESSGTIKYFILACFLASALKNGQLIWVDEFDASLDTKLIVTLIETFNSPKNNVVGSQLIFIAHNTILMNKKLRRDQMVLVDKNEYGESSINPIHTAKNPVRINASIEEEYRSGTLNEGKGSPKTGNQYGSLFDGIDLTSPEKE
ncbi:ATP-binding protein [Taibaiella lutea]|uniref:ATP-binding protein n=1 Tax=Taibaiella lutea TaxID=2608001 RepID=A0A5M6CJD3_9BACT|nr:ATP-binding protein [Taibaiella lutea]KAA5534560.1 ATP-binding protein [Taibaiella lutea]